MFDMITSGKLLDNEVRLATLGTSFGSEPRKADLKLKKSDGRLVCACKFRQLQVARKVKVNRSEFAGGSNS